MESLTKRSESIMAYGTWTLFLLLSLAAVLTPGPAMLAIFGHALSRGTRATLPVALGNAFGAVLLIGASVGGLSVILASLPRGLTVLKWAGAAYLLWLGIQAWRGAEKAAGSVEAPTHPGSDSGAFGRGVLIALSNPKALLFFGAVLPQFVDQARPALPRFGVMATTFACLELAMTTSVTFGAQALAPLLRRASVTRNVHRAGGAVMIAAATLLALAPIHAT
jgi:threonine/homoserine/homoserine lactone efflux protein